MAYFDNAATTYPKPACVYDFMDKFYRESGGNAGRGDYAIAKTASELIYDTRSRIKNILHCDSKQVVFSPSATLALNIIIQGLIKNGEKNIYISPLEHNAVTRTLNYYEKAGVIKVHCLVVNNNLEFDLEKIKYQFDSVKPDVVIVNHASNVIGLVAPVEDIFACAKKYSAITVVDMAQTAGLIDSNIGSESFDFAVFAGHKTLFGPTGISGFVMKPDIKLSATFFGGTGFDSANQEMPDQIPERFEMGTMNISGIAGLNSALRWIQEEGINCIYQREQKNRQVLLNLLEKFNFIRLIGYNQERKYVGIVSCLVGEISSDSIGNVFTERGIALRTGLHCAPFAHKFLNTFPSGTVRMSVSCLTNENDFNELEQALEYIGENL